MYGNANDFTLLFFRDLNYITTARARARCVSFSILRFLLSSRVHFFVLFYYCVSFIPIVGLAFFLFAAYYCILLLPIQNQHQMQQWWPKYGIELIHRFSLLSSFSIALCLSFNFNHQQKIPFGFHLELGREMDLKIHTIFFELLQWEVQWQLCGERTAYRN